MQSYIEKHTGLTLRPKQIELLAWLQKVSATPGNYLILQSRNVGASTLLAGFSRNISTPIEYYARRGYQVEAFNRLQNTFGREVGLCIDASPAIRVLDWIECFDKPLPIAYDAVNLCTGGINSVGQLKWDSIFKLGWSDNPNSSESKLLARAEQVGLKDFLDEYAIA